VLVDDWRQRITTQGIVSAWQAAREARERKPDFQNIVQPNMGLSYARNAGAHAATGEVLPILIPTACRIQTGSTSWSER
jgi:hypothetical protein